MDMIREHSDFGICIREIINMSPALTSTEMLGVLLEAFILETLRDDSFCWGLHVQTDIIVKVIGEWKKVKVNICSHLEWAA